MTQPEVNQTPGAGRRFVVSGELRPFGDDSRDWHGQTEFKVNIKKPNLRGPEWFWCPEDVAVQLKELVGAMVSLDLVSDRVKDEKPEDENYWNYWCKIAGLHDPGSMTSEQRDAGNGEGTIGAVPQQSDPPSEGDKELRLEPFPQVLGEIQGHLEKLAMDWFTASFTPAELRQIPHSAALHTIRLMRDELFWDLKSNSIAPLHYCYEHQQSRGMGKNGGWGHRWEEAWCIEPAQQPPVFTDAPDTDGQGEPEPEWEDL